MCNISKIHNKGYFIFQVFIAHWLRVELIFVHEYANRITIFSINKKPYYYVLFACLHKCLVCQDVQKFPSILLIKKKNTKWIQAWTVFISLSFSYSFPLSISGFAVALPSLAGVDEGGFPVWESRRPPGARWGQTQTGLVPLPELRWGGEGFRIRVTSLQHHQQKPYDLMYTQ